MNARLIKETKDLLPLLAGLLLLIVVPCSIWQAAAGSIGSVTFSIACAVLGGYVFGMEFQYRTLSLLLTQPISRAALWRDKMLMLGTAILLSAGALAICLIAYHPVRDPANPFVLAGIALCAFCGGPYWTLMLRNGLAGVVAATAVPLMILILTAYVTSRFTENDEVAVYAAGVLIFVYCGIVCWLGYRRFARLQVLDVVSRELSLPVGLEGAITRPFSRIAAPFRGSFASLLKKEFRVQQVSFLLCGVFFLIAVGGFCLHFRYDELGLGIVYGDFFVYIIILPLIAGAISIAEERGWGIAEWHLTLPPSAGMQWSAKMLATFSTSLALGVALPAAMFLAGDAIFGRLGGHISAQDVLQILCWVLAFLLVTSVAVYAASASRNTLRAILGGLAIIAAAGPVFANANSFAEHVSGWLGFLHPKWATSPAPIACLGALVVMLCVTQWLAWSNFRRIPLTNRRLLPQLAVLYSVLWLASLGIAFSMQLPGAQ